MTDVAAWRRRLADAASRQRGRLFLWLPVAFGLGAAAYLCLPVELDLLWFIAAASLSGGLWIVCRRYGPRPLSGLTLAIVFIFAGALVCKLRADLVDAPVLPTDRSEYNITAVVVDVVSGSAEAPRLMLAPVVIRGVPREQMPLRLRVTLRPGVLDACDIRPGDTISAFAILNPPPSPLIPGGYDFARNAYFQGVGGVGFIPGQPRLLADRDYGWRLEAATGLNRLRWNLTRSIVEDIKPGYRDGAELGGFAAALVTGHQAFVPQELIDEMRDSGLAHILSISGVHMAVVGAFVFFALRWCMAAVPWLALRVPIKKVAAAVSIVTVALYLAVSGTPAPAVRAAVVAWVAFAAILLDRRALSLRALAIAAFIVILLTPEAVIQPGFQMSFCATAALLAMSEAHRPPIGEISVPWWVRTFQKTVQGLWLSILLSLVATLATTPFSIAYFNRFSVYGLLSNLFEAPITTFIVMPGLAVGTVLSETPIGPLALQVAAGGLWLIARVAEWTAGLKGAVITWPGAPDFVMVLSFFGLIWVCLIRGWARWLGIAAGLAILYWPRLPTPDVWIDPQGGNAAIRKGDQAYLLRPKVRRVGYDYWSRRYGFGMLGEEGRDKDYDCAGYACTPWPDARLRIGFWFSNKPPNRLTLTTLCLNSNLVVLRSPVGDWPADCSGVNRISAGDFRRLGAIELTRRDGEWHLKAAQLLRGERPWTRPSDAEDSY